MKVFYVERQMGYSIIVISLLALLYVAVVMAPMADVWGGVLAIVLVMLLIVALFYRMSIKVDESAVEVVYGVGLIRKRIPVEAIERAAYITPSWWVGAGIRFYTWGWLYSINFTSAVEFVLVGRRMRVAIGTKDPQALLAAIDVARAHRVS